MYDADTELSDRQLRRGIYGVTLTALLLPPFIGGTLMGIAGFYPLSDLYRVFLSYTGLYVLAVSVVVLWWCKPAANYLIALSRLPKDEATRRVRRLLGLFPWYLAAIVSVYSFFGALSTDFSLVRLGVLIPYTLTQDLYTGFGASIPVVITVFPIFFYFVDMVGKYLGSRGIVTVTTPLRTKILLLGILIPVLVDTALIAYYGNRDGHVDDHALLLCAILLMLALIGVGLTLKSMRQGLAPLQRFLANPLSAERAHDTLVPQSLDELGILVGTLRERTDEEERLRKKLAQTEDRLLQAISISGLGLFDHNQIDDTIYWSPEQRRIYGFGPDETVTLQLFLAQLHPDDLERISAAVRRAHDPAGDGSFDVEHRIIRADGTIRWVQTRSQTAFEGEGAARRPVRTVGAVLDTTERKAIESERSRLAAIVETSADAILSRDLDGTVLTWNESAEQLFGYRADEIVGKDARLLVPADRSHEVTQKRAMLARGEKGFSYDTVRLTRSGRRIDVSVTQSPLRGTGGELIGASLMYRDITLRKASELRAQRASNLYAALSQCNRAVVYCSTEQELFENICEALVKFGGVKMAWIGLVDASGKRVEPVAYYGNNTDYLRGLQISLDPQDPTSRGPTGIALRECQPVWCQDFLHDARTVNWHESGRRADWRASAAIPLRRAGIAVGTLSLYASEISAFDESTRELIEEIGVNISFALDNFAREAERKRAQAALSESETRFRTLLEVAPEPIVVHVDGRYVYANPAALEMLGARSVDEIAGKEVFTIVHPDSRKLVQERIAKHMSGMHVPKRADQRWKRFDGTPVEVEVTAVPFMFDGKRAVHVMARDVTERARSEEAIRRLNESLELKVAMRTEELTAANRELEAFAYSVSHDLRAPLRGIDGFSKMLERDYGPSLDDDAKSYISRVRTNTQRMGQIIDDLLALSRLARAEIKLKPLDLTAMARAIAEELQAGSRQRKVEWRIAEGLAVQGDSGIMRIALENLLGNAWKYTGRTPAAVIEFFATESGASQNEFCVRDNGVGFDMAYSDALFKPFQRLHDAREFEGQGIGLAIVQRALHRQKGTVRAEGRVGQGAAFYFSLPNIATDS